MPDEVRALRGAWPSVAQDVPELDEELEQEFRFGQRITRTERGYVLGGPMKGGSSSMWQPATKEQYRAFRRWQTQEGLLEGRDDEAYARLRELLARHEVELVTRRGVAQGRKGVPDPEPFPGYGPLYGHMAAILEALPEQHLRSETLQRIQLGGWGPDAAKASAYHERSVLMYDFACRGARRTFLGLFLHELGHAFETGLPDSAKDALYAGYKALSEADAFYGVEFLLDAATRVLYQKFVFVEFLAETYMVYAACGQALRDKIQSYPPPVREAWERVYDVLRTSFHGVEYE